MVLYHKEFSNYLLNIYYIALGTRREIYEGIQACEACIYLWGSVFTDAICVGLIFRKENIIFNNYSDSPIVSTIIDVIHRILGNYGPSCGSLSASNRI